MKKKTANLSIVNNERSEEEQKKRREEWENAEKKWRITPREARQRVRGLRDELESYRDQIEGIPFDIPTGDYETLLCLDSEKRKYHIELVEDFNPLINGVFEMIDSYARQHGCHDFLDFQSKLYSLKSQCAQTGFQIGVLAGAIFAGCPKENIDRFERGLTFAMQSNHWLVEK